MNVENSFKISFLFYQYMKIYNRKLTIFMDKTYIKDQDNFLNNND